MFAYFTNKFGFKTNEFRFIEFNFIKKCSLLNYNTGGKFYMISYMHIPAIFLEKKREKEYREFKHK